MERKGRKNLDEVCLEKGGEVTLTRPVQEWLVVHRFRTPVKRQEWNSNHESGIGDREWWGNMCLQTWHRQTLRASFVPVDVYPAFRIPQFRTSPSGVCYCLSLTTYLRSQRKGRIPAKTVSKTYPRVSVGHRNSSERMSLLEEYLCGAHLRGGKGQNEWTWEWPRGILVESIIHER